MAAEPFTVSVAARSCPGRTRGSGFFAGGRLLTSWHLVAGADTVEVGHGPEGRTVSLPVTGQWPGLDLAAAGNSGSIGPGVGQRGLELATRPPTAGDPVVIVARPAGGFRWLAGSITVVAPGTVYGVDGEVLLLDRAVVPGWSGGAVLDPSGRVVGVVRGVDKATDLSLVIAVDTNGHWPPFSAMDADASGCES